MIELIKNELSIMKDEKENLTVKDYIIDYLLQKEDDRMIMDLFRIYNSENLELPLEEIRKKCAEDIQRVANEVKEQAEYEARMEFISYSPIKDIDRDPLEVAIEWAVFEIIHPFMYDHDQEKSLREALFEEYYRIKNDLWIKKFKEKKYNKVLYAEEYHPYMDIPAERDLCILVSENSEGIQYQAIPMPILLKKLFDTELYRENQKFVRELVKKKIGVDEVIARDDLEKIKAR